ncbi:3-ketoacyl-CoA reductase [Ephemerocybe angulata]|uniref:Very-long-chain 3-oxoacyl-CoA reductase n=1 Tax=Ephemerocybe angulata TaxID=980116 RepID=A0A8H6I7C5_9AGAR|nr:3-ketoacyl-CoA reductase [Tulosesus angulatus]
MSHLVKALDLASVKECLQGLLRQQPAFATVLLALGSFSVIRFVYQTLSVLLQTFVLPGTSLKKFGAKKGAWAVVTGATDGIGKEFAGQLAKAGFNVLLVARNTALLSSVGEEIQQKYKVQTQSHSVDFAKSGDAEYEAFEKAVAGLDVGVLVNNVGKSHSMPVNFVDTPQDELKDIPAINVDATIRVTHAILPGMVQRKRGLILNVGSFAGAFGSPMLAVYSATKAFLSTFSDALGAEVKKDGIIVEHLNTYFVVSKLSKIRRPTALIPTPAPFVRSVLSKVADDRTPLPHTGPHALLDYGMTLIGMPTVFIRYTHNLHKDIRRRALRKKEREAKAL